MFPNCCVEFILNSSPASLYISCFIDSISSFSLLPNDISSSFYRKGFTRYPLKDNEKIRVDVQMETLFSQYEGSWKNLNGLISGVLLFGELLRIEPFDKYSDLLSYLVLSGELTRKGLLPPYLTSDSIDELKAAFSLALKRGNYQNFTSFIERAVIHSYKELFNV